MSTDMCESGTDHWVDFISRQLISQHVAQNVTIHTLLCVRLGFHRNIKMLHSINKLQGLMVQFVLENY